MKTHILMAAATLFAVFATTAHAKIERVIEKTFAVSPGGTVLVETQGGNIEVKPVSGDQVKVTAIQRFRTDSESEADEIARDLRLNIDQAGNDVSAVAKYEGTRKGGWFGNNRGVSVDFVVTVPARSNVNLRTSGGNLVIGDLTGKVDARTSGGDVRIGAVDGPINARTSGGNIRVREAKQSLAANTSGGDIQVERAAAGADLDTSGGNIHIGESGGAIDARTSGGNIYARFAGSVAADTSLRTSGGNVTVDVAPGAAFALDASTSGGSVRFSGAEIAVTQGQNGKSKLVGTVNGGGPALRLRTSGGDVRVAAK
jgi:hypothetical protein